MLTVLTTAVLALASVVSARSVPYYFNGRVRFDYSTTVEVPRVRTVSQDFIKGSLRDMNYMRWVYITREGYEYEGTLAEVQELLGSEVLIETVNEAYRSHYYKRSIFGSDDRVQVTDTEVSPYSAIGKLDNGCTGTFIASKTVLTAGHCVYNSNRRQWYNRLNIHRKKSCDPDNGVEHTWNKALTTEGWWSHGLLQYDFALVFYGEESPVFMAFDYNDALESNDTMIVGYPSDKASSCQWKCEGQLKKTWVYLLGYYCDTYYGMNGGPIIIDNNGTGVVYGINARGRLSTLAYNTGPRITSDRFTLITTWINNNNN